MLIKCYTCVFMWEIILEPRSMEFFLYNDEFIITDFKTILNRFLSQYIACQINNNNRSHKNV